MNDDGITRIVIVGAGRLAKEAIRGLVVSTCQDMSIVTETIKLTSQEEVAQVTNRSDDFFGRMGEACTIGVADFMALEGAIRNLSTESVKATPKKKKKKRMSRMERSAQYGGK